RSEIPPAGEGASQPMIQVRAASSERKLVKRRSHKPLSLVEGRRGALAFKAIFILRIDIIGADNALTTTVVDRLRVRITKQKRKSVGHAPREFRGERVLVGFYKANDFLDKTDRRAG